MYFGSNQASTSILPVIRRFQCWTTVWLLRIGIESDNVPFNCTARTTLMRLTFPRRRQQHQLNLIIISKCTCKRLPIFMQHRYHVQPKLFNQLCCIGQTLFCFGEVTALHAARVFHHPLPHEVSAVSGFTVDLVAAKFFQGQKYLFSSCVKWWARVCVPPHKSLSYHIGHKHRSYNI